MVDPGSVPAKSRLTGAGARKPERAALHAPPAWRVADSLRGYIRAPHSTQKRPLPSSAAPQLVQNFRPWLA
jgi:hypothetical protein